MKLHCIMNQEQALRDELFYRMRDEGLLRFAMSSVAHPSLELWRSITAQGKLLRCGTDDGHPAGCALLTPFRGRVWEFDATAFRDNFFRAADMVRGGLAWAFEHLDCAALVSFCPRPNRHAWRLAQTCGLEFRAVLPEGSWWAAKNRFVDTVCLLATPETLARACASGGVEGRSPLSPKAEN